MPERAHVFALTGDDVVRFTLKGTRTGDPEALLRGVGARCLAVNPHDSDRLYVGTLDRGLYASEDGGRTWRNDEGGLNDRRVLSVAVSPSHLQSGISVVYAGTEPSNLYRSEDGGHTWQCFRLCAICRASRAGRFLHGRGPITCARSRFIRPTLSGSPSESSWAA